MPNAAVNSVNSQSSTPCRHSCRQLTQEQVEDLRDALEDYYETLGKDVNTPLYGGYDLSVGLSLGIITSICKVASYVSSVADICELLPVVSVDHAKVVFQILEEIDKQGH